MESEKQQKDSSQGTSEVAKFYEGKSLFITGAAGFLGTILLETLLRCCPGILHIYILLRPKKGVQPEDRKENIFKKQVFYKIREKYPDVLNKVIAVAGDVAHDNLGMSSEDLYKVSQDVSIVFHCAANISFTKPLSFMIQQNVIGTSNVIDFCKKLKTIEVFCYTSTAFSNCNYFEIEERIYKLPFKAEEIIKAYKTAGEEELMSFFAKCEPKFPNFYTFSKCVTETLIAEKASDFPTIIVRPSVVVCCIRGPLPGYIEDGTGLTNIAVGVGKGFIRVLQCDPEKKCNQIPVDVVINAHIIGAYRQVVDNLPSPFVYNSIAQRSETWYTFISELYKMVSKHPLPDSFQNPSIIVCKSKVKYWIHSVFDHYGPAAVIDALLRLSGKKPRLLKLYQFYEKNTSAINYFMMNEWKFKSENFESLSDKLNTTDKELFSIDLEDYSTENLCKFIITGAPMYQKDYATLNIHRRPKYLPLYVMSFIKWTMVGILASAFYVALF